MTVCQPPFLKCTNGKQTGRVAGSSRPWWKSMDYSLEQNLGDTQRPAHRSRFIPHCSPLTSFLGPCLSSPPCSLWNMSAQPRCAFSEPAGDNRLDNMLRSRHNVVYHLINLRPRTVYRQSVTAPQRQVASTRVKDLGIYALYAQSGKTANKLIELE